MNAAAESDAASGSRPVQRTPTTSGQRSERSSYSSTSTKRSTRTTRGMNRRVRGRSKRGKHPARKPKTRK